MNLFNRCLVVIVFGACTFPLKSALCLEIELNFLDGFEQRSNAIAAMEMAANIWETRLSDPVTVYIDVIEASPLELGLAHGGTSINWYEDVYPEFRAALADDASAPYATS